MMLVAAGLMTGCGKDSEETPTNRKIRVIRFLP